MSSRSSWRGLRELAEAKELAQKAALLLERLHKEHRTTGRDELKQHSEKMIVEIEEAQEQVEQIHRDIMRLLEEHRKKIAAKSRFLERHYKIG